MEHVVLSGTSGTIRRGEVGVSETGCAGTACGFTGGGDVEVAEIQQRIQAGN